MAQFQRHFVQDLTETIPIRQCGDLGFTGDNLSDVISVDLYTDGVAYSGGGTCAGACICPDGSTVALTGSVSGKTASVSLTEDCFAIPGQIGIAIRVTSGTIKTTVLKAIYNVEQFSTDNPVDPGSRIALDVGDLVNRIDAATADIPASDMASMMAGIAPTFSATTAYPSGAYVYYNGTLYRFTTAHAAGSWAGTDATAVALGNDVADLKSAINGSTLSDNLAGYVNDSFTYVPNANWRSLIAEINMVMIDDTITLQRGTLYGYNGNDAKISSIGFFDSTGTRLFGWYVNQAQGTIVKRSQIPDETAFVVFNTTNVNAGFDIACNPLLNQITSLRDDENAKHCRTCTLESAYNGGFVYKPLYVRAGDIVAIKGTYNGNDPVLFFSDGKRDNQWIRAEQIDASYFTTGYVVPTSGWAGFTGWAATETGNKNWKFEITVFTPRNVTEPMTEIVVAANDSTPDDKKMADMVCDGTDDATVINNAISVAQRVGVPNVVLCNGNYSIKTFVTYNLHGSSQKVAILIHNALGKEGITLRGRKNGILPHGAKLNVDSSIFTNLGNDTLSIISGGAPDSGYQGSHGFNVKDLMITLPDAQHKCIAINMEHAYWGMVENCYLQCTGYGQDVVPANGCIGFRGWSGWSDGINIGVKDTYAFGFYVGFQLGGEHVICERLGTRYCYYGYTFGEYALAANSGAQVHPITLINCCDEHSAALPKFCNSGNANTPGAGRCAVDMISFNIEAYPLTSSPLVYAEESTPGGWVGRIDYTIENNEKNSNVALPFWQSGHGLYFRTTNSAQLAAGTTAERANYAPNLAQTYYDTTLGKLLVYNGSAWVDANGTAV